LNSKTTKWWAVGVLAVLASGCSMARGGGERTASSDPATREVQAAQERSKQAIEQAREAQQKATEQAERAADAQREVQEAQRRLAEAQEKARQEHEKARQFQQEANRATQQASADAQQAQQQASQALTRQSERIESGEQVLSGQVLQATGEQVVVRPQGGGDPMTFVVNEQTRVQIGNQQGSASDLRQGEDARVSYELSGTEPTATSIQVLRADGAQPAQTQTPGATQETPAGTQTR
jgi:colicin import membrane protein